MPLDAPRAPWRPSDDERREDHTRIGAWPGEVGPVEVGTGEVKAASSGILRASALGSCVAVALVDPGARVGGVAHVMLPGRSPSSPSEGGDGVGRPDHRYCEDAIRELDRAVTELGGRRSRCTAILVGGGNVLGRDDCNVGELVLASTREILDRLHVPEGPSHVGGNQRRSLTLEAGSGRVFFTVGDSHPALLWEPDL